MTISQSSAENPGGRIGPVPTDSSADWSPQVPKVFILAMSTLIGIFLWFFFTDSMGQQANVFFLKTADYMMDLYNNIANSADRNFYHFGEIDPMPEEHLYPPLAYFILYPLSKVSDPYTLAMATTSFFWFVISVLFTLLIYEAYEGRRSYKLGVTLSLLFSGLFICSFERGNLAVLTALLCGFFIFNYSNDNKTTRELAVIALSFAAALKGYPIVLVALLLFDKKHREVIRCILYSTAAILLPFLFVKGGLANIPIWIRNIGLNSDAYEFRDYPRFGFRYFLSYLPDFSPGMASYLLLQVATVVLVVVATITTVFHTKQWKRVAQLVLCIMFFPVNSGIYTGLLLFPAIVMFLGLRGREPKDWLYLTLMVLILNPLQYTLGSGFSVNMALVNLAAYALIILLTLESLTTAMRQFRFTGQRMTV